MMMIYFYQNIVNNKTIPYFALTIYSAFAKQVNILIATITYIIFNEIFLDIFNLRINNSTTLSPFFITTLIHLINRRGSLVTLEVTT